ncbi:sugar phosphate isomerase/epimerase [Sorangium sp. So ce321]|uniref:sugar phosphate isomerase/epimerase family protein n=1 Tax=Sorangium sp. So ce321 TaxID=3133300 RepID=UPI003F5F8768
MMNDENKTQIVRDRPSERRGRSVRIPLQRGDRARGDGREGRGERLASARAPAARAPRSIATVSLGGSLPEKLEAIAAAGFDGVEIVEADLLGSALSPTEVRRRSADLGLRILLFQPLRDIEGVEAPLFHENLDRARRFFDVTEALGCELVLVCSNVSPDALPEADRASEQLGVLADVAAERGLRVGYEALAWGRHVCRWREAYRLVNAARRPNLGLVVDSFHTLALDDEFEGLRKLPDGAIEFIQLSDAPRLAMDLVSWSRHHRCFPGQGALPVARFLAAALASGYSGPVSLEIFNGEYRTRPPGAVAADGIHSLIRLEESLASEAPVRRALAPPQRRHRARPATPLGPR